MNRRRRSERLGMLELQTLRSLPSALARDKARKARYVVVVKMNMGQILQSVQTSTEAIKN